MKYKVLIADRISPAGVALLREQEDIEVTEAYGAEPEALRQLVVEMDAVIVRSETQLTRAVMEVATKLKAVGRAGVGVDNIDVEAATEHGVVVMNAPEGNTIATAELTFAHILCGARPLPAAHASMRRGEWDRKQFAGTELQGKTLAILGMGRIGTEVARRALAFAMRVLAVDPYLTVNRARSLDVELVDLDTALREADYLTVHMPLTENTQHMIDEKAFARMKDGVRLFNVARGGIIRESALIDALQSGKVAAAGLDVYEDEPPPPDHPLRRMDHVVLTPHLGASTREAQESVGQQIAQSVLEAIRGGVIRHAVNAPTVDAKTLAILRPYLRLGTKLGTFLQQITPNQVERIRIAYWGRIVELDALPLTRAIQRGYLLRISGSEVNDVNAPHKLKRLGIEVETVKSSGDVDYNELVEVRAMSADGRDWVVQGTLIGKANTPRIVHVDGRDLEVVPAEILLMVENRDAPGTVGRLGTLLGEAGINIANMSLHRSGSNETALAFFELDSEPDAAAMERVRACEGILRANLIYC